MKTEIEYPASSEKTPKIPCLMIGVEGNLKGCVVLLTATNPSLKAYRGIILSVLDTSSYAIGDSFDIELGNLEMFEGKLTIKND